MRIPTNDESFDDEDTTALVHDREYSDYQRQKQKPNPVVNFIFTGIAYIQFFWIHHRAEFILGIILFGAVSLAVTGVIEAYETGIHTKYNHHTIGHDYSDIKSSLELKLGTIDHWCLDGTDKHCPTCDDPTKRMSRLESAWWSKAFMRNAKLSKNYLGSHDDIDVIFLGDSNTEARAGTFKGDNGAGDGSKETEGEVKRGKLEDALLKSKKKFDKYFDKSTGAKYNGLALGIAGDTSPNLLWRITQNEMNDLKPKVWWINIGINDILSTNCSEEIALMGILRIVEELIFRNDGSTIVINSILPVATRSSMSLEGKHIRNKYWVATKLINERLQIFAKKHPGVKFFDATDILTENRGSTKYMQKALFMDKVHLSPEGQDALASAQADVITAIYEKKASQQSYRDAPASGTPDGEQEDLDPQYTGNDDLYGYPVDDYVDDWFTMV